MDATKNERRIAKNGKAYTYKEFAAYYNSQILFAMWQEAAVLNSAEQPANTDGSTIQEYELPFSQDDELAGAAQPVDTIARRPENSVEQPVSTVCLSWDELAAMPRAQQSGGKAANAEQKRLREQCFANGLWEIDITDSTYNWKQLLKAMPEAKSRLLVGAGVAKFSFRLLQTVCDHNYIKIDSGETHVFEIVCVDGLR